MSEYKVYEANYPYFMTLTVVEWLPLFLSKPYIDVIVESLVFCRREKGMRLHGYVVMPDHLYLISSSESGLATTVGQLKSFTSHELSSLLEKDARRLYLWVVRDAARKSGEGDHKVWQKGNHPEQVYSRGFLEQKLDYIHGNPVRKGLVADASDWVYSSASYYETGEGVIEIDPVEW